MRATIMQPYYLGWLGHFALIDGVEVYVSYDDVQFNRRSWQCRNRVKMPNGITWISVPTIDKFGQKINEIKINNSLDWRKKHWETIRHAYTKAPYFDQYSSTFKEIYEMEWIYLADLIIETTKIIADFLGIKTRFLKSSDIKTDRLDTKAGNLVNILRVIGATEYMAAEGAKYLLEKSEYEKFKDANIKVFWRNFIHPHYSQLYGEFVPNMSIIDLLFNEGGYKALDIIRKGENPIEYVCH